MFGRKWLLTLYTSLAGASRQHFSFPLSNIFSLAMELTARLAGLAWTEQFGVDFAWVIS